MAQSQDMTTGSPGRKLFAFAVPMVVGNLFQQLYNIVDSIIVGKFIGPPALAAVGASTSITFLFVAVATGLSIGSSVVISQYFGARRYAQMKTAVSTILISAFVLSFVLMLVGVVASVPILRFMNTPGKVLKDAASYLRIYFYGLVFLFCYNMLTAVFNALGDSKKPLYFLIFTSFLNIGLDLLFVVGFSMGVAGAALATTISQGVSAVVSFGVLFYKLRRMDTEEKTERFDVPILKTTCRIAIPSMLQQSIVSIGMICVQALVNSYGETVMAGYTAATKIDSIAIMPMVNVGSAMSTFTAQNIGAERPERVKKGIRAALAMTAGIALTVTAILFLFGDLFIGFFVSKGSGAGVIAVGVEYLRVVSVFYVVMGTMNSFNGILRGAGDVRVFMASTLCNFSCRVAFAYSLSRFIGQHAIWWAIPIGWFFGLLVSFFRYRTGKWKEKSLIK